jgi:hypothetical protein
MVEQLARVDNPRLLEHLDRLRQLADQLAALPESDPQAREIIDRLGRELDSARHVVRPYFKR